MKAINPQDYAAYEAHKIKRMIDEIILRLQEEGSEINDPHFIELAQDSNKLLYHLSEAYTRFEQHIASQ